MAQISLNIDTPIKRGAETSWLDPDDIVFDPAQNVRWTGVPLSGIAELADEIEADGQKVPLQVYKNHESKPELIAGHRRLEAIKLINQRRNAKRGADNRQLASVMFAKNLSPEQILDSRIAENVQREDLSVIDIAHLIVRMQNMGRTIAEIQKKLKLGSPADVTQKAKLTSLPDKYQRLVHTGKLSTHFALRLVDVDPAQRDSIIEEMLKEGAEKAGLGVQDAITSFFSAGAGSTMLVPDVPRGVQSIAEPKPSPTKGKGIELTERSLVNKAKQREAISPDRVPALRVKDIKDFLQVQVDSTVASPGQRQFAGVMIKWIESVVTEKTMQKYYDALVKDETLRGGK